MATLIMMFLLLAQLIAPAFIAPLLRRARKHWSGVLIAILSALPLPALIWAICGYVYFDAATASAESCGVDACGMATMAAMFAAAIALGIFLFGLGSATVGFYLFRPKSEPDVTEVFR